MPSVILNRTSSNLGVLVHGTSEHFKIFLPLKMYNFQEDNLFKRAHSLRYISFSEIVLQKKVYYEMP